MCSDKAVRTRLSPEKRKELILDAVAKIVTTEGVSAVTMERTGREANISKTLVYTYFNSLSELLAALLTREFEIIRTVNHEAAVTAKDFPELVRLTTRIYLKHMRQQGPLLERLMAESSVLALVQDRIKNDKEFNNQYLSMHVMHIYGLSEDVSLMIVQVLTGLTGSFARYCYEHSEADLQQAEDYCVTMLLASLKAISENPM